MEECGFILFILPFILLILGLLIWSLVWVYNDAKMRGKPGWLIVLLVLLLDWPISLLVWLAFRPEVKES